MYTGIEEDKVLATTTKFWKTSKVLKTKHRCFLNLVRNGLSHWGSREVDDKRNELDKNRWFLIFHLVIQSAKNQEAVVDSRLDCRSGSHWLGPEVLPTLGFLRHHIMSQSLFVPPYFDESNYAYWKVRMRAFLKSLDERVWVSVQNGRKPPSTTVSGVVNLIDISLWTKEKLTDCNWNSKGLHALFMTVSPEEFMRVSMFEEIRMKDDESCDEFYAKLNDIVNSSFNLGEKIFESKIVRKVLRSLPERFRPKVTMIEESMDLDMIKIEELVGSLQTYELTISQPK
ncbi:uncharacterized protein LOC111375463 [Olea europaea var. sylvestris]|uniref:uncharacterized protein LOC111375463 n=1 Tax=Olea europaea var. sylvestris TaxID=158386 RepID=UPI000C1D6AB1|nr:uncharacterized protein LOC111375463 [Olea europaea var. sylvestris]